MVLRSLLCDIVGGRPTLALGKIKRPQGSGRSSGEGGPWTLCFPCERGPTATWRADLFLSVQGEPKTWGPARRKKRRKNR